MQSTQNKCSYSKPGAQRPFFGYLGGPGRREIPRQYPKPAISGQVSCALFTYIGAKEADSALEVGGAHSLEVCARTPKTFGGSWTANVSKMMWTLGVGFMKTMAFRLRPLMLSSGQRLGCFGGLLCYDDMRNESRIWWWMCASLIRPHQVRNELESYS